MDCEVLLKDLGKKDAKQKCKKGKKYEVHVKMDGSLIRDVHIKENTADRNVNAVPKVWSVSL